MTKVNTKNALEVGTLQARMENFVTWEILGCRKRQELERDILSAILLS